MSRRVLWAVVLATGGSIATAAEPPPNSRAAVDKGMAYLRSRYGNAAAGAAPGAGSGHDNHALGEAALAGLALLEGGAPATDPAVMQIAATVRRGCLPDTHTYHVSLNVLFLDRLSDPADRPLIQILGIKLYAGLQSTGGWSYQTGDPLDNSLLASLQETQLDARKGTDNSVPPADGFVRPATPKDKNVPPPTGLHPIAERLFRATQARLLSGGRGTQPGDNSNTQFGLIGLWVAARNGLPADDAFTLIERRFLVSQNRDAGWTYTPGDGASTPAMTCAGLLGLAVGAGKGSRTPPDRRRTPPAGPGDGFVPTAPKKADDGPTLDGVRNKRAVQAALAALAAVVRASPGGRLGGFVGLGNEYYLLWSVERVCMAYNLSELGGVDWYQWGCDFLLPAQQADGSWPGSGLCSQDVDTCFAILFLMRSNLVTDLSSKLGGIDRTLRAGDPDKLPPAMKAPRKDPPPKSKNADPKSTTPETDPLVTATDAEFAVRLAALRDTKGGENTQTIARAIPKLSAERQAKARTALAERLTRMTANTLRGMLKEGSEDLKRAAATAVAYKGDKSLLLDLADLIDHPSDPVVQAARDALKTLTGQDHGPQPGSDAAARAKAQAAWRAVLK